MHIHSSFREMSLALFREHFLSTGDVASRVMRSFVDCVALDRSGQAIDRSTLASVQRMCGLLRVYSSHLEPAVLANTTAFFEAEGVRLIGTGDVPSFLRRVEEWLREEVRLKQTKHSNSLSPSIVVSPPSSFSLSLHCDATAFCSASEPMHTSTIPRCGHSSS